jgi:hypothetical protein
MKHNEIKPIYTDDTEFFKELFNGTDQITGNGKSLLDAWEYMIQADKIKEQRRVAACIVLHEKPREFLLGMDRTKYNGTEGIQSSQFATLAEYLPKHAFAPKHNSKEDEAKFKASRAKLPTELRMVNFTMVTNIALLAYELEARLNVNGLSFSSHAHQWSKSYRNPQYLLSNPSLKYAAGDIKVAESKRIYTEKLEKFCAAKPVYDRIIEEYIKKLKSVHSASSSVMAHGAHFGSASSDLSDSDCEDNLSPHVGYQGAHGIQGVPVQYYMR